MARDLFVASLALGVNLIIGLKRPLQGEILPSSRLPLNVPRRALLRKPRGCVP